VIDTVGSIEVGRTRVCDLYPMIESRLDANGYGDFSRARLKRRSVGHQIGIVVHERPWLDPESDDTIVPGMVFCVEDMVLVSASGAEILTTFDRDLFEI
jgi:Xaa-Pro aminopeptidase